MHLNDAERVFDKRVYGSIEDYLILCKESNNYFPTFIGYRYFRELWDRGYLVPGQSMIKLHFGMNRNDIYLEIVDGNTLERLSCPRAISCAERFDARKILVAKHSKPIWEVYYLNEIFQDRRRI